MKKIEYVAPELEIVEMMEQCSILADSLTGGSTPGQGGPLEDGDVPEYGD